MRNRPSKALGQMTISIPKKKVDISGYETVDEYLARGGQIQEVPFGFAAQQEGKKRTQAEIRHQMREEMYQKAKQLGRLK